MYSILPAKKLRQSINVLNLTGIAHVPTVRALRKFMPQVRHRNVRTILLKQALTSILPSPDALVEHEAHNLLFGEGSALGVEAVKAVPDRSESGGFPKERG